VPHLTATFSDGTESPHSSPFAFTIPNPAIELKAAITAETTSGTTPLPASFNAASSTGDIASYQWDFGDGATAMGATAAHTYVTAGTFTSRLTA